jgi:hypothetical protein
MTVLLRSFIVWLMLLAVPYQGYASATMMLPVASIASSAAEGAAGAHDHAAMMAAMQLEGPHAGMQHEHHHGGSKSSHDGMKCGGSASCCACAASTFDHAIGMPSLPLASVAIAFYSEFLPAVDLAHPERPPQGTHA